MHTYSVVSGPWHDARPKWIVSKDPDGYDNKDETSQCPMAISWHDAEVPWLVRSTRHSCSSWIVVVTTVPRVGVTEYKMHTYFIAEVRRRRTM